MPGAIHVTKAADIKTSGGQTEGMVRQNAIVDLADNICALGRLLPLSELHQHTDGLFPLVMIAEPHTESAIHHHGEESKFIPYPLFNHSLYSASAMTFTALSLHYLA